MIGDLESAGDREDAHLNPLQQWSARSRSQSQHTSRQQDDGLNGQSMEALRSQLLAGLQQQGQQQPQQQHQGESELEVASRQPSAAMQRWHTAVALVTESRRMQQDIDKLQSRHSTAADKFVAAASLLLRQNVWQQLLLRNPHNQLLRMYTEKKRARNYRGLWDRIDTELYLTGALIFDWCTPSRMFEHWMVFTCLYFLAVLLVFFFMAGQWPYYLAYKQARLCWPPAGVPGNATRAATGVDCSAGAVWPTTQLGPDYLLSWVSSGSPHHSFSFSFMRGWGARYNPDISNGMVSRWFTSQFVHTDFRHILSNMLLFLVLAGLMEVKYGSVRVAAVWSVAYMGGQLLSVALENPCIQVTGASGGVFGLFGLYVADLLLNMESVKRPIMRSCAILGFLAFFLYNVFSQKYVSHVSHMGGMLCGLFPAFLFLPRLQSERCEALLPLLGILVMLGVFAALPVYLYAVVLPPLPALCGV